jgi:hypothetical protein
MNTLRQLAVVAIFGALAGIGLHAQNFDLRANIPFDFHAGDRLMPAGEYLIHGQGPVVFVRRADNGSNAFALTTIGVSSREAPRKARLDFNCYGSEYFLTNIWDSFAENGRQLQQTSREKELARLGIPVPSAVSLTSTK